MKSSIMERKDRSKKERIKYWEKSDWVDVEYNWNTIVERKEMFQKRTFLRDTNCNHLNRRNNDMRLAIVLEVKRRVLSWDLWGVSVSFMMIWVDIEIVMRYEEE